MHSNTIAPFWKVFYGVVIKMSLKLSKTFRTPGTLRLNSDMCP